MKMTFLKYFAAFSLWLFPLCLHAQGTAIVEGVVRDNRGEAIAGLTLTLTNVKTGITQSTVSGIDGTFRFVSLPTAGSYTLQAQASGFKKAIITDIVLRADERRFITLDLKDYASDEVTVVADFAPQINRSDAEVSSYVSEFQIQTIPTDGRKISNQLYFLPGVAPATGYFPEAPNVSINGQNSLYTNYLIDGFDNNERFLGGQKFDVPIGIAQNVAVLTNSYSAAFGRTANGIVNITTKSGTNEFKGEIFYYSRPGAIIDAPNAFSPLDENGNPIRNGFNRNQVGLSLSGPIVPNQTFFFFNTELTQDGVDNIIRTPATNAVIRSQNYSYLFTGKIDHKWNSAHQTSLRANVGIVGLDNAGGGAVQPSAGSIQDRNALLLAAKHTWLMSSRLFSETRVQYSRFYWNYARSKEGAQPQVVLFSDTLDGGFGKNELLGIVGHPGFTFDQLEQTWQAATTLTAVIDDKHTLRAGLDLLSSSHRLFGGGNPNGNYTVRLRNDAQFARRSTFSLADIPRDVDVLSYSVEVRPESFGANQTLVALFVEDSYNVSPRLTLNLGLRWDFDNLSKAGSNTYDWNNLAPRLSFNWLATEDGLTVLRGGYGIFYERILYAVQSDALQFSSRSPAFLQQLRLLQQRGIIPDNADLDALTFDGNVTATFIGRNAPEFLRGKTAEELRANINALPARELRIQNPNGLQNPFSHQFSLGVQRQLTNDLMLSLDGVVLLGQNLVRLRDLNAPTPYATTPFAATASPRPLSDADASRPAGVVVGGARQITVSETEGRSEYYGILLTLKKAFSNNYAFQLAYTLSWNLNNTDDINFRAMDANEFQNEWGFAVNDRRHVLALTGAYRFDFGTTLSLNLLLQSGQPINRTVALSNAVAPSGVSNPQDYAGFYGHGPQYGDGFAGNLDRYPGVPRNGERLPGFAQLDLSVSHLISFGDVGVELRADIFNVFNAINYSGYFANATQTNRAQVGRPGDPIQYRSAGIPTQYQFSARMIF
jgi:outer membrane receptor for ferrienterochelin and colicin